LFLKVKFAKFEFGLSHFMRLVSFILMLNYRKKNYEWRIAYYFYKYKIN